MVPDDAARVVRVLPDVPALPREFDYALPADLADGVELGTVVRIPLHGRRVRGWVVGVDVTPPEGVRLQRVAKVTGHGPPPELIDLARWGAWRWAGSTASVLRTATAERAVRGMPAPARRTAFPDEPADPGARALAAVFASPGTRTIRLPPATDVLPLVLAAVARGNALVLCPTAVTARTLGTLLRRAGVTAAVHPDGWAAGAAGSTVLGTRAAVWAPVGALAAVLVLDEHEEAHQQEQAPTWHARDVAIERARRAGVPCVLHSPCPSLEAIAASEVVDTSRAADRSGWPPVVVADRRVEDPVRAGAFSPQLLRLLHGGGRVVCVLNRIGRAQLLACAACGELARCDACGASVAQPSDSALRCRRCGTERPVVCVACGATNLKVVRAGVTRVVAELEALLGERIAEVTASSDPAAAAQARVVVGTEAALHQVRVADAVAFLDLDQELLAGRYRAAEQALALVARAARIAGKSGDGRGGRAGGLLLLQTRCPEHEVVQAALHADPGRVARAEVERRRLLRFPPEVALAVVSGPAAHVYVTALEARPELEVLGPAAGRWLVRAADHATLCDALAATPRPPGRLRIEVDPLRI